MEYNKLKQALLNVVNLQDKMNTIFNHKPENGHWLANGNDWILATTQEAAEFVNWITYKWWKKPSPNNQEAFVELVDILHFQASYIIQKADETSPTHMLDAHIDVTIASIANAIIDDFHYGYELITDRDTINDIAKTLLYGGQDPVKNFRALFQLVYAIGYTAEDLFKAYTVKNVLNEFRQLNGDREGTYIKIWDKENNLEDNAIVFDLVEKKPDLIYDLTGLMYELNVIYSQLPENKPSVTIN